MKRWNFKTRQYEPYSIPSNWNTPLYSDHMHEKVNCACCGGELEYGRCYTSRRIHSEHGFGYPVCAECYDEEWESERKLE